MVNFKEEKSLIAYYSREGNNYVSGRIVNLPIGNTEVIAKMIKEMTEGVVFRIDTVNPYPEDYTETTEVAQKEKRDNARPELSGHVKTWIRIMNILVLSELVGNDADAGVYIP